MDESVVFIQELVRNALPRLFDEDVFRSELDFNAEKSFQPLIDAIWLKLFGPNSEGAFTLSRCRHLLVAMELTFRCRDCETDNTCVLCVVAPTQCARWCLMQAIPGITAGQPQAIRILKLCDTCKHTYE